MRSCTRRIIGRGRCHWMRARAPSGACRSRALALALIALLAAGFVFAARAVEVRVEPEPERLSVRGLPHLGWDGMRLLLPGDYTVRARARGLPAARGAAGGDDRPKSGRALRPGASSRPRARRDEPRGRRARSSSTARSAGRRRWRRWRSRPGTTRCRCARRDTRRSPRASAWPEAERRQTLRATLVPDRAPVSFASAPAEALVRVDGADVGRTPLTVDLSSGAREVTVTLAGHKPAGTDDHGGGRAAAHRAAVPPRALARPSARGQRAAGSGGQRGR